MTDVDLQRLTFYVTNDRVVRIDELTETSLRVTDPETRETWTIRRAPFEANVADGRVRRVIPNWEPARTVIEVEP